MMQNNLQRKSILKISLFILIKNHLFVSDKLNLSLFLVNQCQKELNFEIKKLKFKAIIDYSQKLISETNIKNFCL